MKVLVGMSGGVDSTVTAYLLKQKGYEVIGVNFDFLNQNPTENEENANIKDLHNIEEFLGIKIYYKNYAKEFSEKVIKYFVDSYKNGLTPNPCAMCNGKMKFKKLIDLMNEFGCDMIATGHYANIAHIKENDKDLYCIKKSQNKNKDQSYFLYNLSYLQLSHIIFPIGDMDKNDVRRIAREIGLVVAEKKESQDVCFLGGATGIDYKEFIKKYDFGENYHEDIALGKLSEKDMSSKNYLRKGEFVDSDGTVLGYHNGIINYTIGQRKGLNIAFGERKFVKSIDATTNKIVLCDNDDLYSNSFSFTDVNSQLLYGTDIIDYKKDIYVKVRYRHEGTKCSIKRVGDIYVCELDSPVRAITKGQAAVFYDTDDRILFGGVIL